MTRWDYKLVPIGGQSQLSQLQAAGEDGWEAVALEHGHVLCKRPRPVEFEMHFGQAPAEAAS